jgi:hypothetical protein
MSDEQKLQQVKQLIQQKEYAKARQILRQMSSNPTAKKWLIKLDDIAPALTNKSSGSTGLSLLLFIAVVGLIAGSFLIGRMTSKGDSSAGQILADVAPTLTQLVITPSVTATPEFTDTPTDTPTPNIETAAAFRATQIQSNILTSEAPCTIEIYGDWWTESSPFLTQFLDTAETAVNTSRGSLSPIILELSEIYRNLEAVEHPECISEVRFDIRLGMDSAIDGFNEFLGDSEVMAEIDFSIANQYFFEAYRALMDLNANPIVDLRLFNTRSIWGGDSPEEPTPTPDTSGESIGN